MKLYRQTKIVMSIAVTALLLSACGGGGEKAIDENKTQEPAVTKIVNCTTGTFTPLNKGDKITSLIAGTEVTIRHSEDGKKEACIVEGDAQLN